MTFTGQLGTPQSQPGRIALGATGGPRAIDLSANFSLDLAMAANIGGLQLHAAFRLDLALWPNLQQTHPMSAAFVLDLATLASITQGQELAADFALALTLAPGIIQRQYLTAGFVLDLVLDELYTGPGSGLVVGGQTTAQLIDTLAVGDEFQVTLAWAGVRGRTGLARVLSRSRDASQRLTFVLLFVPTLDPSLLQSQITRPRLIVATRDNLARRLVDAERNVNKLQS